MRTVQASIAALLLSAVNLLASDLTLTQTTTDRGHGSEQTQLWTSQFMRINHPETQVDILVDFAQGVSYTIHHSKRVIQKMSWDDLELVAEAAGKKLQNLPPLVSRILGVQGATVRVEEVGTEVVLGRSCHRWKVAMGPALIESSNDPTVLPPVPAIPYQRFLRLHTLLGQLPLEAGSALKIGEELSKVQGLALKYRVVLPLVGETTTLTTRMEEGPISPESFELPANYSMEDAGKRMREDFKAHLGSAGDHPVSTSQVQPCSEI